MIHTEWLRDSSQKVVGCIAAKKRDKNVIVGYSLRHPTYGFDPNLARQLAIGRMIDDPIKVDSLRLYDLRVDAMFSAMLSMASNKNVSSSVRRGARRWISLLP